MKVYSNQTEYHIDGQTAVAIGKFDGEHMGHRKLLHILKQEADKRGLMTAIFTFYRPPADVVGSKETPSGQIMTNHERASRLEREGMDYLVEYPFTDQIASMEAEDFVRDVLVGRMHMKLIVAGPDCAFGYQKKGDAALLKKLSPLYDFEVIIIDKQLDDKDREISSTLIKEELESGHIEEANLLLGSTYSISGTVVRGNHIGGRLGFPTVNIVPDVWKYLPKYGVYATKVSVEDGERKISYFGLTNVGINPTVTDDVGNHMPRIETNLYDCKEDLYGSYITICFYGFIRPEMKFDSMETLKHQIESDKHAVAEFFGI